MTRQSARTGISGTRVVGGGGFSRWNKGTVQMMDNAVVEIELGHEGFDFVAQRLAAGRGFSRALQRSPTGRLRAVVGRGTPIEHVTRFWTGGIYDQTSIPATAHAVPIPNFDGELVKIVADRFNSDPGAIFIVEDAAASATDPGFDRLPLPGRVYFCGDDVFHLTFAGATSEEILQILKTGRTTLYFIAGLTRADPDTLASLHRSRVLATSDLERLAKSTTEVFVGAYDGESFLVWRR
jgi:hypothetical protein